MNIGKNKILHALVCAAISLIVALITGALGAPVITAAFCGYLCALSTGLGKEYGDKTNPNNKWDWKDILADIVGGVFGALLAALIIII